MLSGRRVRRSCVMAVAVAISATVTGFLAVRERREAAREELAMGALLRGMGSAPLADGERITINGASVVFRMTTFQGPPERALDAVARDCASGDRDLALGSRAAVTEGPPHPIVLDHVRREAAPAAGAALCVFRRDDGSDGARAPRARFALARAHDDQSSSVFSVATTDETSLAAMFPSEGDAPGGDLDGFPRPRDARRTFVAALGSRAVRIYEARVPLARAVQMQDEDAARAGFSRDPSSAPVDDARLYTRGDVDVVASFREVEGLAVVTITKLRGTAADLPRARAEASWP